ncbi:Glutamate synthase [NADPH] large chain [hydrothermal vent metagenome]|uniref:Glutamate synthase [NADPH] large chain n=1 Tax=hydrothermal vent metagenome TaxID=652676 RepID=A0A3B0W1S1_9ZZZZ
MPYSIVISISDQTLSLFKEQVLWQVYAISSALNGVGGEKNSGKTPLGKHVIRAKIGEGCPINSVFIGRRPTGEIYTPELACSHPERDWVLSRILWLSGQEVGVNRLGQVDTMQRYIYIHGTPDSEPLGQPLSHGCIRMRNADLMALFDCIPVGTEVLIQA